MLQKAEGNLVTHHKQTGRGGGAQGTVPFSKFNTLLRTIIAGVEGTSEGKGFGQGPGR